MAHFQQIEFCKSIKEFFFYNSKISVLELGSYNVNGTLRDIFTNTSEYLGLDIAHGPCVDHVYDGKVIDIENKDFDLCISCECFEHNPYYIENLLQMIRLNKNDGVVVFTCATIGRTEHGTAESETPSNSSSPPSMVKWNYYKNLKKKDFTKKINFGDLFLKHKFYLNSVTRDLYFVGIKDRNHLNNFINFNNQIIHRNTNVSFINPTFSEIKFSLIHYLFNNVLPYIIGDYLTRKLRIFLKKFL
jgi:SAM-dependent methyltransferase